MRTKLNRENEKFNSQHIIKPERNARSAPKSRKGNHMKWKILEDPEIKKLGYVAYEHP
jgi:hypothetical protein